MYERAADQVLATPDQLRQALFGPQPLAPEHRGSGLGKALLAALARIAVQRGCARLEWAVLDWNQPSIEFYRALGAVPMEEWTVYRLAGPALIKVAGASSPAKRDGPLE